MQLKQLHERLYEMGRLCGEAIAGATGALQDHSAAQHRRALQAEREIDMAEHDIEQLCMRLLLHQQPMAADLRHVHAAQMMITDMERIGDQAADIAEIAALSQEAPLPAPPAQIAQMADAASGMVAASVDAFVRKDLALAKAVIASDDHVDDLFEQVKQALIARLRQGTQEAEDCVNLLMIAKYLERIGDHAENLAEWVVYYLTGMRA
jgi:phosphate transport system protein